MYNTYKCTFCVKSFHYASCIGSLSITRNEANESKYELVANRSASELGADESAFLIPSVFRIAE